LGSERRQGWIEEGGAKKNKTCNDARGVLWYIKKEGQIKLAGIMARHDPGDLVLREKEGVDSRTKRTGGRVLAKVL